MQHAKVGRLPDAVREEHKQMEEGKIGYLGRHVTS